VTGLACWLLVVGAVDLFRARRDTASVRRLVMLSVGGGVAVIGLAASAHPSDGWGWCAWCVGAVLVVGWVIGSGLTLSGARRARAAAYAAVAYAAFGLSLVVFGLAGARTGQFAWLDELLSRSIIATSGPERVLVALAVIVVQVSTANILIRMLLDLVGVPAQDNEKALRGGRVLGPMERLVIVGLGLAGSLTGATVVVAAKALLRFPELRPLNSARAAGASDVTEYFLIGSFASWMVAFGSIALASV
jgi:hypothetical protein